MLSWQRGKNRISIKAIAILIIQAFLLTSLGYSESLYHRNISSTYIDSNGLRVPVGFGKIQSSTRAKYRMVTSLALETIANGLKYGLDLGIIIEKSFGDSFKEQLDGPIYIRQNPVTQTIYARYGNVYMSLSANGGIADSNEEEFRAATKETGVIQSPTLFSLDDYIFDKGQSKRSAMGRNVGIIGLVTALVLYSTDAEKQVMLFGSGIIEPFETSAQVPVVDNHATVRVLDRNELAIQAIRKIIRDRRMSLDELIKNSVHPSASTVGVKDHAEVSEVLGIEGIRIVDGDFVVDEKVIERLKVENPADIREFIHNISSHSLPVVLLGNLLNNIIHQEGFDWDESSRLYRELERILAPRGMMTYATNDVYFHWYKTHEKRAGSPETKETRNVIQTLEDAGLDILFKTTTVVTEYEGAISDNCILITGRSSEYNAFPDADEAIRVSRERLQATLPQEMQVIERTTTFDEFKRILESGKETNLVLIKSGHDQYVSFNVLGRYKDVFTQLARYKDEVYFGINDALAEIQIKKVHSAYQKTQLREPKEEEASDALHNLRARYAEHYQRLGHRFIPRQRLVDQRFPDVFIRSADPEWFYPELIKHVATNGTYIPESQKACTVQPSHRYGDRSSQSKSITHLQLFEMGAAWYTGEAVNTKKILEDILNLLESYGLDKTKLRFTVLRKGELEANPYLQDADIYNTWLSLGIRPDQISFKGPEDNLWMQGGVGIADLGGQNTRGWLMGESTEIFYEDIEISNILFPTFVRQDNRLQGPVVPLRFRMCETVVGLDRLAMILQQKDTVFDIDSIAPLCSAIREVTPETAKSVLSDIELENLTKIVADDLRALLFLVTDGALLIVTKNERVESRKYSLLHVFTKELLEAMKILKIERNTHLKYLLEQAAMPYAKTYPEVTSPETFENVKKLLDARQAQLSRVIAIRLIVTDKGGPGIVRKLKKDPDYALIEADYSELEQFGLSRKDIDFATECFRSCVKAKSTGDAVVYTADFLRLAVSIGLSYQELKSIMTRELGVKLTRDIAPSTVKFPTQNLLFTDQVDLLIANDVELEISCDREGNRVISSQKSLSTPIIEDKHTYNPINPLDSLNQALGLFEDSGHSLSDLVKDKEVVVLGPGPNLIEAKELLRRYPGIKIVHVVETDRNNFGSIFREWISLPLEERSRIVLHRADICSMPFDTERFAMVYAAGIGTDVLGEARTVELLKEMHRILMNNGAVVGNIMLSGIDNIDTVLRQIGFTSDGSLQKVTLCYAIKLPIAQDLGASNMETQVFGVSSEHDSLQYVILGDSENFRSEGEGVEQINAGMRQYYGTADAPDKYRLAQEYSNIEQILKSYGVTVYRPKPSLEAPQQLAPRDIGFVIGDTFVISNMTWKSRKAEIKAVRDILDKFSGKILEVPSDVRLEGGNVVIDGDTIFVGIGLRTTPNAVDFLRKEFGDKFKICPIYLNEAEEIIHLDAVFNIVGKGYAVVYAEGIKNFSDIPNGYKFLRVTKEEKDQGACNMLSINGKALIVRKGLDRVKGELEKEGFICHEVPWDETKKTGTVGPRCATLPLRRAKDLAPSNLGQIDGLNSVRVTGRAL